MPAITQLTLFQNAQCHYCHRVRLVLAEKGIEAKLVEVDTAKFPPLLAEINPYTTLPTLADRDLVLYESTVVMEYLEERYPHPPLLPSYPLARAHIRLLRHRIDRDWYTLVDVILDTKSTKSTKEKARQELKESLTGVASVFMEKPFFLSDEMTLADCCLLPLLWRLPQLEMELPKTAKGLHRYMEMCFGRSSFDASLSATTTSGLGALI